MDFKQMQKIVDGAPEWAIYWDRASNCYTDMWIDWDDIAIEQLKLKLSRHDTLDLEPADIPHGTIVLEK